MKTRSKPRIDSPLPRQDIFRIYWYFAAERQQIFELRREGLPGPWTSDPILQRFKFCNAFRVTDRVSQYLMSKIIAPNIGTKEDVLFQICMFRFFSKTETWDYICQSLGHTPLLEDLRSGALKKTLERAKVALPSIYTSAFILCALDPYGLKQKHLTHLRLFEEMFINETIANRLLESKTLGELYSTLCKFPLIGDFMGYQIATDMNYTEFFRFDENEFTKAGPGAKRGIQKMFENTGSYCPEEIIHWTVSQQDEQFKRYGLKFHGLYGRKLHAIDVQNLYCEVDKYCREAVPALKSNRSRIKTQFSPRSTPHQLSTTELVLPRHWAISTTAPEIQRSREVT